MDLGVVAKLIECFTATEGPRPEAQCVLFSVRNTEKLIQWYGEFWAFGGLSEVSDTILSQIGQIKLRYHSYSFHYDVFRKGDEEKHDFVVCFEDPNEAIHFRLNQNVSN